MLFSIPQNGELTLRKFGDSNLLITAYLEPLLGHSKSIGPSAPIVNSTYVSPPNETVAWPAAQVSDR